MANINLDTIYELVDNLENNGYVIGEITSATTGEVKNIEDCNDEDMLDVGTFRCNTVAAYEANGYEFSYAEADVVSFSIEELLKANNN